MYVVYGEKCVRSRTGRVVKVKRVVDSRFEKEIHALCRIGEINLARDYDHAYYLEEEDKESES